MYLIHITLSKYLAVLASTDEEKIIIEDDVFERLGFPLDKDVDGSVVSIIPIVYIFICLLTVVFVIVRKESTIYGVGSLRYIFVLFVMMLL